MKFRYLPMLLFVALLPATGLAQSDTDKAEEEIRFYDVEVAIFKNVKAPKSREFILPVSSPTRGEQIFDLASPASVAASAELGYQILSADAFRLLDVVARLVESPRYELLLHVAWRQPGVELENALPVWIKGGRIYGNEYTSIDNQIEFMDSVPRTAKDGAETGSKYEFDAQTMEALQTQLQEQKTLGVHRGLYELEGKITIALSRYLHTYTDLVLRRPRLAADSVPSNPATDQYLAAYAADTRILNNHSLKEHRRMRSRNLHYLDNPEFGLLIIITPYEKPEAASSTALEANGGESQ